MYNELTVFLAADYSQIEIRVLAEVSNDKLLLEQFRSGRDIHCLVGHALTGWPESRIAKDNATRRLVKNMHFAIVYGVSRKSLYEYVLAKVREQDSHAADLKGITRKRLEELYDAYFERYEGVARYIRTTRRGAEERGYVENLFGFRRELGMWDDTRTTYWGNQAVNTPIQGCAHQLVLIALAILLRYPRTFWALREPVMDVHDALYFFLTTRDLPKGYSQVIRLLQEAVPDYVFKHFKYRLRVPLVAECSAGYRLGTMVEYKGEPVEQFLSAWRREYRQVERRAWEAVRLKATPKPYNMTYEEGAGSEED